MERSSMRKLKWEWIALWMFCILGWVIAAIYLDADLRDVPVDWF